MSSANNAATAFMTEKDIAHLPIHVHLYTTHKQEVKTEHNIVNGINVNIYYFSMSGLNTITSPKTIPGKINFFVQKMNISTLHILDITHNTKNNETHFFFKTPELCILYKNKINQFITAHEMSNLRLL